ncbi:amino acid adenylation domain-containing protein [Micromonospora sediminicola]|uniref:Amino acid adenylation domain-containing protein n=1 Tax=Micromonospora sediminicola TaxID=946078 RepID=A0A1A9B841_9ACTN|nr:amino acid adenylation domain-containing protein [Micromonospora sediminicola]SBT65700.1 amino acid adenylation domain-containing protein [Micromonospora sediminicola]
MSHPDPATVGPAPRDEPPQRTTPLPPWVLPDAEPGRGSQRRHLPAAVREALAGMDRDGDRLTALVLAAWLAVLARCVGEPEVSSAVADRTGHLDRVSATVGGTSWTQLAGGLRRSRLAGPASAVLDLHGAAAADRAPLLVRLDSTGGELGVSYETACVSHSAADRVLGYLARALALALDDPEQRVDLGEMLSEGERRYQLDELCGPRVNNGPDGFVPAFRARAAAHPDRPALHHRAESLTYGELDRASDRVAARLSCLGVSPGQAVAVVSDRHLDWVVAMLGVLKAGAVYLPVRPDFPASRVEDQLSRAECGVALTDDSGAALLSAVAGLGWPGRVSTIAALRDGSEVAAPLPAPGLDQPAYVYFTSGSTGRPKGAVCAHDGMINHLWAKVDDHDLGPKDVVTQTASQCFDISLWQICAPLLVGGAAVVVDTDQQLDVAGFAALLARHRVTTVQIVPSYLEVLLAHLEAGAVRLPRLASVSVTGEALKADLVRRWFSVMPGLRLVNAYGATEVSDDTMHEVLDGPPDRDLSVVNVGRPLRNMRVYVVDDQRRLMPLGARGEIVFAGVCVGGGYINDPERTAEAFGEDPYFPGERLYRSGDLGRWLPEKRLEFLGRRDDQVKIRGLRVETGEIQAALLRVPGISAAAVVPVGEGNGARLVGFYVSEYELASIDLHDLLSARLPEYMVPAHHFRLAELPLNENGKTDNRRLRQLAEELAAGIHAFEPPRSGDEQRLATLWAEVLGLPAGRVGRHDDFFDLGGTSLSAVHLLMRLDHQLSLTDMLTHSVLRDQARLLEAAGDTAAALLLHELSPSAQGRPALVCLPDAGGNAINFQHLADLAGERVQVLAVELPGHDLARRQEDLLDLPGLAERLGRELAGRSGLYLWGQGAGGAAALATARALERAGTTVAGVILAWDETTPEGGRVVDALSDDEVVDRLRRRHAYVDVDRATPGRAAFVARAYRHDWAEALRLLDRLDGRPDLDCPVVEVTLGAARGRLRADPDRIVRRDLPGGEVDVARHHPDEILGTVDGWHERVAATA